MGPSTKTQGLVSGQIRSEAVWRLINKDTGLPGARHMKQEETVKVRVAWKPTALLLLLLKAAGLSMVLNINRHSKIKLS